jgi:hypothetical protein
LLVRLLDALGFETDVGRKTYYDEFRAGLESSPLEPGAPYVVKVPSTGLELDHLIESGRLDPTCVDYLVVPIRDLNSATASRIEMTFEQRAIVNVVGGVVKTTRPGKMSQVLAESFYQLMHTVARHELPLLLLDYPKFAQDAEYAHRCLSPLLDDTPFEKFAQAWEAVVDPDLLREAPPMPRFMELRAIPLRVRRASGLRLSGLKRRLTRIRN